MNTSTNSQKPALLGGTPAFRVRVPITEPTIPPKATFLKRYVELFSGKQITNAKYVREFETQAAKYLGVKHAVALNSCTSGLMLALRCLGVKGKVILPSFTFCATGHAPVWNNLTPILVDCDPRTYNVDIRSIEKAITPDTTCIIGVHMFGNPASVEALQDLARRKNLKLIFDAAHGFGSLYGKTHVGNFGNAEVFSLSPTKLLTAGEGGLLTTNDDALAEKIRIGRNYGLPPSYDCQFVGLNARMSEMNAILGLASLRMLEKNVKNRNRLAADYMKRLSALPGISFQEIRPQDRSTFKDFSILIDSDAFGVSRNALAEALLADGIESRKYFDPPMHGHTAYAALRPVYDAQLPITNAVSENILSLPLYSHMPRHTVHGICAAIERIHQHHKDIALRATSTSRPAA